MEVRGLQGIRPVAVALAMVLVAVPATVAADAPVGHTGPFVGTVEEDRTRSHTYDNNPTDGACIDIVAAYTVYLTHQLATDTLLLSIDEDEELQAESESGQASVTFMRGLCAEFTIEVTGLDVEAESAYAVTVCRGNAPLEGGTGVAPLPPVCLGTVA